MEFGKSYSISSPFAPLVAQQMVLGYNEKLSILAKGGLTNGTVIQCRVKHSRQISLASGIGILYFFCFHWLRTKSLVHLPRPVFAYHIKKSLTYSFILLSCYMCILSHLYINITLKDAAGHKNLQVINKLHVLEIHTGGNKQIPWPRETLLCGQPILSGFNIYSETSFQMLCHRAIQHKVETLSHLLHSRTMDPLLVGNCEVSSLRGRARRRIGTISAQAQSTFKRVSPSQKV